MLYTVSLKFRGNTVWDSEAVAHDTSSHPSETALAKPLQICGCCISFDFLGASS